MNEAEFAELSHRLQIERCRVDIYVATQRLLAGFQGPQTASAEVLQAAQDAITDWYIAVRGVDPEHAPVHSARDIMETASRHQGTEARFVRRPIPHRIRRLVLERDGYRCAECRDWHDLSLDHLTPVSLGGSNDPDNLRVLCRSCNSRKGARL